MLDKSLTKNEFFFAIRDRLMTNFVDLPSASNSSEAYQILKVPKIGFYGSSQHAFRIGSVESSRFNLHSQLG